MVLYFSYTNQDIASSRDYQSLSVESRGSSWRLQNTKQKANERENRYHENESRINRFNALQYGTDQSECCMHVPKRSVVKLERLQILSGSFEILLLSSKYKPKEW